MKSVYLLVLIFCTHLLAAWPDSSFLKIQNSQFSFFTSHELTVKNFDIKKVIISIHGSTRNADTYYKTMAAITRKFNQSEQTLIIAPKFKEPGDLVLPNELIYSNEGWWIGSPSVNQNRISSFTVMDKIIERLLDQDNFPNVEQIILTGHSAGGHFTQRYALASMVDGQNPNVKIQYIVANPGTYAYLSAKRAMDFNPANFQIPHNPGCLYNNYKYGLDNLNAYFRQSPLFTLLDNYIAKDVTYFIGQEDIGEVETNCQANFQGTTRYQRGVLFKAHIDDEFPNNTHKLVVVPGVGHTQHGMYNSSLGHQLFFPANPL